MDNYVGKRLDGRYEIQEIIGVGGMAVVYKAYDNIDDRIVAVKILKEEFLANEEFRRRFKNESKAIAVLSHPNIVKVYDVSFGDKLQYIVMEYIDGITLKEYIEQQKIINWKEAVHFTIQILRALQHAHDKGIVHRDIKPQNIMLLQNGNIKVADFGIARFSRGETRTMTESAIGSVHYISPEQARGEITDDKADIYSVGVVLYEMLTGQLPFQSDSAVSVAIMQLQSDPKMPREVNDSIPLGLEQITMRAMQKNVKDRYQSAAEMLLDLDEFKRNPAIKFDYNFFVDKEPTKFVDGKPGMPVVAPILTTAEEPEDSYDAPEEKSLRAKTVPIIAGIAVGLVAVVGIVLIILSATGFFSRDDKVKVPSFVGQMYDDVIKNETYKEFWDCFLREQEYSSDKAPGTIIRQTPVADAKINPSKDKITLVVATASETKEVPRSIKGQTYEQAKKILEAAGFTSVTKIEAFDEDKSTEKGQVFKSDPMIGNQASLTDTITLFVNNGEDTTQLSVPNLEGLSFEKAQERIQKLNESEQATLQLVKGSEVNSSYPAGTVVKQTPPYAADAKMDKNAKITVDVSNGRAASNEITHTITLPSVGTQTGTVTVFQGDKQVGDKETRKLNGATYTFTLTGSGSSDTVEVRVDNQPIFSGTLDFENKKITNQRTTKYQVSVPNVVGKSQAEAERILQKEYGFSLNTQQTASSETKGKVFKQEPGDGRVDAGSTIKIFVSTGSDASDANEN